MKCEKTILNAEINETIEFIDWGMKMSETVIARRDGITVTANASGRLRAWTAGIGAMESVPISTGWIFGDETSPEQAIDRVIESERGWAGLAAGAAEADKYS